MLAVTKNRTKRLGGWQGSCAVCVDLQVVGALEFFGELYSLAKGFGPFLRAGFREREGSIFSNRQHFALCTGSMGVACPLPAFGGSIHPWYEFGSKNSSPEVKVVGMPFPCPQIVIFLCAQC